MQNSVIVPILISSAFEWVVKNHEKIVPIAQNIAEFTGDLLIQGGNTIKQIGNTVIWNRPNGQSQVLGLLDQIDNRIDDLQFAYQGIKIGLSGLKNLSMVTLGFTGISAALLMSQLAFLNRRLGQIQKELKKIQLKIDQAIEAKLQAGLNFLQAADTSSGNNRSQNYQEALGRARDGEHFFRDQAINPSIHENKLELIQFYARKYFLALSVELGSLMGLGQTDEIRTRVNSEEANLKAVASQIFKLTLSNDLEFYLSPEMRDIATLESISVLLEQAQKLGCIPHDTKITPADVFEANRKNIFSGKFFKMVTPTFNSTRKAAAQKLQTAYGTFEEITRLLSWREAINYLTQNGRSANEVANALQQFRETLATPTNSTPFVAYSVIPQQA